MARSARELFEEAMRLDPAERAALMRLLIDTLDAESEEGAEDAWRAEVERRIAELAQMPVTASQSMVSEDLAGIHAAAERFLRALDDLDWEPFRASWASKPTVFFPFGDTPDRVIGQVAVEARWRRFFEEARARRPGPPYLHLKPLDIRTERYGDAGLVTFTLELTVGGRQLPLQRRTLLFVRERDAWKLAHMHASGASQP